MRATDLDNLRQCAVARSLFAPVSLPKALARLGFVQADPIRAPARAQDLTLRHRVTGYRAGDLERRYPDLEIEEDFFINYGFVTTDVHALMHPRAKAGWARKPGQHVSAVIDFVRERGEAHPREVDRHFARGQVTNYWGGASSATTHLLDILHFRGRLRVVRRDAGVRVYGLRETEPGARLSSAVRREATDRLIDVAVGKYAPLPAASLSSLVMRIRYGAPQLTTELRRGLARARERLAHARIDGIDWYWPEGERPEAFSVERRVRFLAPFDPVVWDRRRFELLWRWPYRFEAYTPAAKRQWGYYALPLLWRDQVVGWGNFSVREGKLQHTIGYVSGRPRERDFARELDAEIDRLQVFLKRR